MFALRSILLLTFLSAVCMAAPGSQENPNAEEIRRQVGRFREKDLLRVTLQDTSEKLGCLQRSEPDGFFISPRGGPEEKISYVDVAAVKKDQPTKLKRVLRGVARAGVAAGLLFGIVKIGSNTPKTVAAKIWVGSAAGLIALQPGRPTCR
jgi:hypothetical protein